MISDSIHSEWRDESACAAVQEEKPWLASAWIDPEHPYREDAERICLGCPVREICLQAAVNNDEAEGLRGGYWFDGGWIPVAKLREIRDTTNIKIPEGRSVGKTRL